MVQKHTKPVGQFISVAAGRFIKRLPHHALIPGLVLATVLANK